MSETRKATLWRGAGLLLLAWLTAACASEPSEAEQRAIARQREMAQPTPGSDSR